MLGNYETDKAVFIVMEYCANGDLHSYLTKNAPLPEETVTHFAAQLGKCRRDWDAVGS